MRHFPKRSIEKAYYKKTCAWISNLGELHLCLIYLKGRVTKKEAEIILHPLVHSPNTRNSQGWTRPVWVHPGPPGGWRGPMYLNPGTFIGSWIGSGGVGTWTGNSDMGYKKWLNPLYNNTWPPNLSFDSIFPQTLWSLYICTCIVFIFYERKGGRMGGQGEGGTEGHPGRPDSLIWKFRDWAETVLWLRGSFSGRRCFLCLALGSRLSTR